MQTIAETLHQIGEMPVWVILPIIFARPLAALVIEVGAHILGWIGWAGHTLGRRGHD